MKYLEYATLFFNMLFCLPSIASATKFDYWWIRGFDFPRVQISILIIINIILAFLVYSFGNWWEVILVIGLCFGLLFQLVFIYPYTILSKKQVEKYKGTSDKNTISILVSNVLMTNRNFKKLLDLVDAQDPDILLVLETDKAWEEALEPVEKNRDYSVKIPLDNLYGMHLYSKFPLVDMEVNYLVKDDIPSIHGFVVLPNDKKVAIHCLHPRPPSPSESKTSTNRDAELLLVGKAIDKNDNRVLVFGDLNDVAWSRTTKMFLKISGLMDPRRGRGFFNTFNANYKLLRWPLDHVFHTKDFTLVEIDRGPHIGSDHFPMFIKIKYEPEAKSDQESLESTEEDEAWADEKIEKANPKKTSL